VSLGKARNGIASTFEWLDQLDSKTEKVTSLSPRRGTLTSNEYLNLSHNVAKRNSRSSPDCSFST